MTWEYLAGFFDGEGSIVIAKNGKSFRTKISMSNCNKEVMESIATFLMHPYHFKNGGISTSYIMEICEQQTIRRVLTKMLPFLIVRKDKAKIMLEYIDGIGSPKASLTEDIIQERARFANMIGENDNG